jgi:hypothetical protein
MPPTVPVARSKSAVPELGLVSVCTRTRLRPLALRWPETITGMPAVKPVVYCATTWKALAAVSTMVSADRVPSGAVAALATMVTADLLQTALSSSSERMSLLVTLGS